jgi:hypothetical protein
MTATPRKGESDYADYVDGVEVRDGESARESLPLAAGGVSGQQQIVGQHGNFGSLERSEEERERDSATMDIPIENENHHCHLHQPRNQRNHPHQDDILAVEAEEAEVDDSASQAGRNGCPHHPRERLVRFDPAGQAWCDRLDYWDCYRLMKLGEALGYTSLSDRGGQHLIDEGRVAWSAFAVSQRPFLTAVATEAAIAQCKALGLDVPDLSGEVKQSVQLPPPGT